ncbi:MAG: hypothetical protein AAF844_16540, partial [Pseudomonadota bacterium]
MQARPQREWRPWPVGGTVRLVLCFLLTLCLLLVAAQGVAQSTDPIQRGNELLSDLEREAESIESRMGGEVDPERIEQLLNELVAQRDRLPPVMEL